MNLPHTPLRFVFHFAAKQKLKFSLIAVSFMIWAISDSFFPYFLKRIINAVNAYQGMKTGIYTVLSGVLLTLIVFWLMSEFFMRFEGILQIYTFPLFRASIREAVFEYVTSHSHEYFANHFAGDISKKLNDLPTSSQVIMEIICFQFVTALTGATIVLTMMWFTHHLFAFVLLSWLCIHLGISFISLNRGNRLWELHSDTVSDLSGKMVDVFTNMQNVRLFSRKNHEKKYLSHYQKREIDHAKKAMWYTEVTRIFLGINGLGLIFGMIFLLLHGWTQGWVTTGDFAQVIMQSFWLLGWVWFISFQLSIFAREMGTISNALILVKKSHDLTDKKNAHDIKISEGEIRFENVNFSYSKNRPVLENLNIQIPAGQKIGLVGFSGSGKSTFVNLILRFYDVQRGRIVIDNQDIVSVTQESLRSQIAMIPQEPSLFHRSLMENIRYGRIDASDEEVVHASKLAHCDEFISKLDEGYHALVGERGIKLSGGQRQRIAIARAILKNAPILILDEATSSLDSVTEKLIQESLSRLMQNRTTIIIAHRLSTLSGMDKILVFDKGKIVEQGNQEELLNFGGHFTLLWNRQIDGFLPEKTIDFQE